MTKHSIGRLNALFIFVEICIMENKGIWGGLAN
jgi:hypothetical protein